jgi:hypothetical protein
MGTIKKMMKGTKVMKYQNAPKPIKPSKPLSDKDSMNIYANRYDELSASGVKKMGTDKKGSAKDLKAANEARKNEIRLAKKIYGTTPSNKNGGATKKKMSGKMTKAPKKAMMGSSMMMEKPMMKSGGTLSPSKKSVGKTIGKLNKAKSGMKMSKMMSKMSKKK